MVFITFGVTKTLAGQLDTACRIIETDTEASAVSIAEALGNEDGTTVAYTDEALVALACERPDYIDPDTRDRQLAAMDRIKAGDL